MLDLPLTPTAKIRLTKLLSLPSFIIIQISIISYFKPTFLHYSLAQTTINKLFIELHRNSIG